MFLEASRISLATALRSFRWELYMRDTSIRGIDSAFDDWFDVTFTEVPFTSCIVRGLSTAASVVTVVAIMDGWVWESCRGQGRVVLCHQSAMKECEWYRERNKQGLSVMHSTTEPLIP